MYKPERKVFICSCCYPEHQFIVTKYPPIQDEGEEIYVSVLLSENLNFIQRIVAAFKYIFGFKPTGYFSDTLLTEKID